MRAESLALLAMATGALADPELADPSLRLTLFAEDPEIVTPIGMAIGPGDRVFVIESHTHQRPRDYQGPAGDRILLFRDADGDGRADSRRIFAEGLHQAMNLAFAPDGTLFACCAREVIALPDEDGDDRCDGPRRILALETLERYAHNSLMGLCFDGEGRGYLTRGNTGSHAWSMTGSDGSRVEGYGDGGNVIRFDRDGGGLEEVATGFWNPFNLRFDLDGALFFTDNDPDARGPNRLIRILRGGDYGYRSLYGDGGNHPFQGWDGELPGTLGYLAATGEAPCDLIDSRRLAFGGDSALLVSIWNENAIDRFEIDRRGAEYGFRGRTRLVRGGKEFRPVALAADSRGSLFITDWVRVDYPNHGRGQIWRLSPADPPEFTAPPRFPASPRLDAAGDPSPSALDSAITRRRAGEPFPPELLADPEPSVRRFALRWAGESGNAELLPALERALAHPPDAAVFEAYLAAAELLDPSFIEAYRKRSEARAKHLPRHTDPARVLRIARNADHPPGLRALAIDWFEQAARERSADWLRETAMDGQPTMQLAALRQLASLPDPPTRDALERVATDPDSPPPARCEALLILGGRADLRPDPLLPLLDDRDPNVALEAARALAPLAADDGVERRFRRLLANPRREVALREVVARSLPSVDPDLDPSTRPEDPAGWQRLAASGGSPQRGRRVFLTPRLMCANCHDPTGRSQLLGPDLSGLAESVGRADIVRSILDPSAGFAPQYQAWIVTLKDGRQQLGLQLDHKANGAIEILGLDLRTHRFAGSEIEDHQALPRSLMPPGLEAAMTASEFRDLVAYLATPRDP